MQPHRIGDVVENRHRERRRLLEDHADLAAQFEHIHLGREDIDPVDLHAPFGPLAAVEFEDAVVNPQMRGLSATGWTDHRGDPVRPDVEVVVEERLVPFFVKEVQIFHRYFYRRKRFSVHGVSP